MDNIDKRVFDYIPREDAMPWPESESMGAMAPAPLPRRRLGLTEQQVQDVPVIPGTRQFEFDKEISREAIAEPDQAPGRPEQILFNNWEDLERKLFNDKPELGLLHRIFTGFNPFLGGARAGEAIWDLYRHAMDPKTQKESMLGKQTPHRITPATRY